MRGATNTRPHSAPAANPEEIPFKITINARRLLK
jgi:hypothetical protein